RSSVVGTPSGSPSPAGPYTRPRAPARPQSPQRPRSARSSPSKCTHEANVRSAEEQQGQQDSNLRPAEVDYCSKQYRWLGVEHGSGPDITQQLSVAVVRPRGVYAAAVDVQPSQWKGSTLPVVLAPVHTCVLPPASMGVPVSSRSIGASSGPSVRS